MYVLCLRAIYLNDEIPPHTYQPSPAPPKTPRQLTYLGDEEVVDVEELRELLHGQVLLHRAVVPLEARLGPLRPVRLVDVLVLFCFVGGGDCWAFVGVGGWAFSCGGVLVWEA